MIIVTGASRGIGNYLFRHYTQNNPDADVYGTCNSQKATDPKMSQINIADFSQVNEWGRSLLLSKPAELVLINCAGINRNFMSHKADIDDWQSIININLIGTYNVIRTFLPYMREIGYGRIINFSSVVAEKGVPGTSAYAASKSGLWGLSKAIAAENGSKNININNINLGYSDIGMGIDEINEDLKKVITKNIPAKRFCQPEEILDTVEFLRKVGYINGTSISLSGGLV